MSEPTESQKNLINELSKVSGYSRMECKHFLTINDWNKDLALNALKGGTHLPQKNAIETFYNKVNLIRPIRSFTCAFNDLNDWLEREAQNVEHGVNLCPDFQRGHVWNEERQVKFIENVFRKIVDDGGLTFRFNCPTWREDKQGDLAEQIVCIDGLQRITAIHRYTKNEFSVCGYYFDDLPRRIKLRDLNINIQMYDFQNRADLIQFYLDVNFGGMPHTQSEFERVTNLLANAKKQIKTE